MSLYAGRYACPRACGGRAAAWWRGASSWSPHRASSVGGGGAVSLARRAATGAAGDASVDTDALIASYLNDAQLGQVRTFAATLLERNKHMNLTGAQTVDEVLQRHVADSSRSSLPSRPPLASTSTTRTILLTTPTTHPSAFSTSAGAGSRAWRSPSRDPMEVTLLDTLQKRTVFLDEAAAECGAGNVHTWSRRGRRQESARRTEKRTISSPRAPWRRCASCRSSACPSSAWAGRF